MDGICAPHDGIMEGLFYHLKRFGGFKPIFITTQIVGIVIVILTGVYTGYYWGGFAWRSNPGIQFNWHPLLMTIGMLYLYGNGILTYRLFKDGPKPILKIVHAVIMISVFILTVIALIAVFDFHNLKSIPNMYSVHSWMGLLTVILFSFQWLAGFLIFLKPGLKAHLRGSYLDIHVFFGLMIFVSACATAFTGFTEKTLFGLFFGINKIKYGKYDPEFLIANCTVYSIFIFGALVVYLAVNPKFKRVEKPVNESNEGIPNYGSA